MKIKYAIQFGIYLYLKDLLLEDLKNTVFTLKFDECITQQLKKQYDGYVKYWSLNVITVSKWFIVEQSW